MWFGESYVIVEDLFNEVFIVDEEKMVIDWIICEMIKLDVLIMMFGLVKDLVLWVKSVGFN